MKYLILILSFILPVQLFAQSMLKGTVNGNEQHGEHAHQEALMGVNVFWLGSTNGTTTDVNGKFKIRKPDDVKSHKLVISYIGYKNDTIVILPGQKTIDVVLNESKEIKEVTVRESLEGNYISKLKPIKTEVISSEGLTRLACCNLSESFENTATVDVGYTDAVSGAKQIQMLGLAGVYSQLLIENLSLIRGFSSPFGLSYIPGSWMESIQISKGTSSVINGFESITGQINVEFKKPMKAEPLFINLYSNHEGRAEANVYSAKKFNDRWSTILLAHASMNPFYSDHNEDGFMDVPKTKQLNISNRWSYDNHEKGESKISFSMLHEERDGGQKSFNKSNDYLTNNNYGIGIIADNFQLNSKNGFILSKPETSIGIQSALSYHEQKSFFGLRRYNASQASGYFNVIYETILNNTNHKLSSGVSTMVDDYKEHYYPDLNSDTIMLHTEIIPGAFSQYTYSIPEKLKLTFGLRADYNTYHGLFITPRVHFKWDLGKEFIIRGSAGRGYRSAQVLAENIAVLATSKEIVFKESLNAEEAWNYGINFTKEYDLDEKRKIKGGIDLYRTDFVNQVIVDIEQQPGKVLFYNLDGKSYSNSVQADFSINPVQRMEITLAFRMNDVKTTINNQLVDKPYVSRYKGVFAFSYATKFDKWKFDFTVQYNGRTRLPDVQTDSATFKINETSPDFFIIHAQVTKKFKKFEVYTGVENLLDFRQHHAIIAANDPFGKYFDTSRIWGPLDGRMIYVGLRFKIEGKPEPVLKEHNDEDGHDLH